jgi:hypothetical protein
MSLMTCFSSRGASVATISSRPLSRGSKTAAMIVSETSSATPHRPAEGSSVIP